MEDFIDEIKQLKKRIEELENRGLGSTLSVSKVKTDTIEEKTSGAGINFLSTPILPSPIINNSFSGTAKATSSDINTGTNDSKIVTPKSIFDSDVVFTTKNQTLTNKTLNSPIINNPTITQTTVIYAQKSSHTGNQTTNSTTGVVLESFSFSNVPAGSIYGVYTGIFKISAGAGVVDVKVNNNTISIGQGWIHTAWMSANVFYLIPIPFYLNSFSGGNITFTIMWNVDNSSWTLTKLGSSENRMSAFINFIAGLII